MKPRDILLFFIATFASLALISLVFPEKGIRLSESITIDFPKPENLFLPDTIEKKDFSKIMNASFDIDSMENEVEKEKIRIIDSINRARKEDSIRAWQLKLHYHKNRTNLFSFFDEIHRMSNSRSKVRIMHYGDSQIEGDRITGYLRYKLQGKFGGTGPGLIPAVPLARPTSVTLTQSENWKRYTMYGPVDSTVTHNKYGILATYGRFTPLINPVTTLLSPGKDNFTQDNPDGNEKDSLIYSKKLLLLSDIIDSTASRDTTKAWIKIERSNLTYKSTPPFNSVRVLFGNLTTPVKIKAYLHDTLEIKNQTYYPGNHLEVFTLFLKQKTTGILLEFEAVESPDVYGISLDSKEGVAVDNIAMRGSSGTLFKKIDRNLFKSSMKLYHPEMLILQYGGNVMPYMDSEQKCKKYGQWFESQLKYFKALIPKVAIIVIGPSDMGYFDKGEYKSYEMLPLVRDELKRVTLEQGGAYWDLMEAMGGAGSMTAWVEAKPPLASKDYVHFNKRGASKIAQMFYNALIEEYNKYESL